MSVAEYAIAESANGWCVAALKITGPHGHYVFNR